MASIDSRYQGQFRVRISVPGSSRVTRTFDNLPDAQAWASKQDELIKNVVTAATQKQIKKHLAKQPPPISNALSPLYVCPVLTSLQYETPDLYTALQRYAEEVTPEKKGAAHELGLITRWQRHPLASFPLLAIRGHHLSTHRNYRTAMGISGSTLQKEFAVISHLYKVARTDWGFENIHNPVDSIRKAKIANGRTRRYRAGEEGRLLAYCDERGLTRLKCILILAVETAMRRSELVALTKSNVCLETRTAHLPDTKNGTSRTIPLSTKAVAAITAMPLSDSDKVLGIHVDTVTAGFNAACKTCGITGLRFHDLRHEATSRLFEKGFQMMEVAAITGHKTLTMLKRYTHLKVEDLLLRLG